MATLHLLHDVTANAALLTLLTGPRWAIGPRDLRLLGRRAAVAGRRRPARGRDARPTSSIAIADGIDPAEIAALGDALDSPGDAPLLARGARAVRACSRPSCGMLRRARRRAAARHRPPDHRHLRRRHRAGLGRVAGGGGPARQPRPVRQGGRGVPGRRRRRHAAGAAGLPRPPRTTRATASTSPPRPRPTRSSCSPSTAPRAWSGTHVFLVGVCETRFPSNRSRTLWTSSPAVLPAPLRGDARDLPQLARPRQGGARRLPRATPARTTRRRSSGSGTSRSPAPRTASASRRTSGARGRRRSAPRRTRRWCATSSSALGRAVEPGHWLDEAGEGRPQPVRRRRPVPSVARARARAARRRCGSRPRACRARRRPGRTRRRPRHGRGGPGRRLGRRARPARRRGARRPRPGDRRAAAELACRRPRWRRLRERPRDVRPRAGPADAATAVAGRPLRHPVPRLGGGAVRPAGPVRPRRAARPGRRRHRRRRRPRRR